jgi:hypothetical protein
VVLLPSLFEVNGNALEGRSSWSKLEMASLILRTPAILSPVKEPNGIIITPANLFSSVEFESEFKLEFLKNAE